MSAELIAPVAHPEAVLAIKLMDGMDTNWFPAVDGPGTNALRLDSLFVRSTLGLGEVEGAEIECRWWDGAEVRSESRALARVNGRWVLEPPSSLALADIRPARGQLALMLWEPRRHDAEGPLEWRLSIDCPDPTDRQMRSMLDLARRLLGSRRFAATRETRAELLVRVCRRRLRAIVGDEPFDTGCLPDEDFEQAREWLESHLTKRELKRMLESGAAALAADVIPKVRRKRTRPTVGLAQSILRRFGADLLGEESRREVVASAWRRSGHQSRRLPGRWSRGRPSAAEFVRSLRLPPVFAGLRADEPSDYEDVDAFRPLGPLHRYQEQVASRIRRVLESRKRAGRRGIVWLPTGTGKTRVTVETLVRHLPLASTQNVIVWIADREEICEQAVESFRHVWMTAGLETLAVKTGAVPRLRIVRFWGGREWQEPPESPTVVIAGISKLHRALKNAAFKAEFEGFRLRVAVVVFDEAHHVVAPTYQRVLSVFGLGRRITATGISSPPLLGLTATPARRDGDETAKLHLDFGGRLIEPGLAYRSIEDFQRKGYLSRVRYERIATEYELVLRDKEREEWKQFRTLPSSALLRIGKDAERNARVVASILDALRRVKSMLVFACSIEHSKTLAHALCAFGVRAAHLDGEIPRPHRRQTIERFRDGELEVAVNCDLLATGFDAPNVDAVALARPIESPVLFAQIVGRGIRGPRNRGTRKCLILDFEDNVARIGDLQELRDRFRDEFLLAARAATK